MFYKNIECLKKMLNKKYRSKLADNALKTARGNFDWKVKIDQLEKILNNE